jgi:hypothetical protein
MSDYEELSRHEPDESPASPRPATWEEPSYGDPAATDPGEDLEGLPDDGPEPQAESDSDDSDDGPGDSDHDAG